MRLRTLGAATLGTLALGACDDPVAGTDLRPEGPPEVLAVLVFNDPVNGFVESATYCKPNDSKRPGQVGITVLGLNPTICPLDGTGVEPLTDAYPDGWYIRVMFDELLNPDIETLEPILDAMGNPTDQFNGSLAITQPVVLKCEGVDDDGNPMTPPPLRDVPYDGYYSPAGNNVTWPLGPSLVIQPLDPSTVPVESRCTLQLKEDIVDKDGTAVPSTTRDFEFRIAPVSVISVFPAEGDAINPSFGGVDLTFNVATDTSAVFCADPADPACAGDPSRVFTLAPAAMAENAYVDNYGGGVFVGADLLGGVTYTLTSPQGLKIKDKCGKESTVAGFPPPFEFDTNVARFVSFNPGGGTNVAPSKKILLSFNQLMDLSTFTETTDWTLDPKPEGFAVQGAGGGTQIRFAGRYQLGTKYTLTIKAGASISDAYGKQMISFPAEQKTEFTTASAITITAQSPANGQRITKAPTSAAPIRFTFNQEILGTSLCVALPCPDPADAALTAPEVTLTKADGTAATTTLTAGAAGAVVTIAAAALPAGTYKFTLKQGATLKDNITMPGPNTYTQAADRVITFSVADAPPPGPAFKCLGEP